MIKKILETIELTEKNLNLCPWIQSMNTRSYANELFNEVEELKEAFKKNDIENIKEELGDVLWDAIVLAHLAQREGLFSASDVIHDVNEKIKRRKPFLLNGDRVTIEEVSAMWQEAKRKEKGL